MSIARTRLSEQLREMTSSSSETEDSGRYAPRSIETLVVVLGVITILAVVAGILARLCGGRRGEHDIEGWVESKCRSCIDGGIPPEDHPKPPDPVEADKK